MQIKYKGILIYSKINKDNDLIVKFLSNSDELISGIVYGGQSKKKKSIYQIGYFLDFEVFLRPNRPASINAETSYPFISNIVNDKYKLNCLVCVTSLINLSIIEGQKIKNIYHISNTFILTMINNKKWLIDYVLFLFNLLKLIGYEINYSESKLNQYFDIKTLEFKKINTKNTIEFPYDLINKKKIKIDLSSIENIFKIFELIFSKYHLSNFNLQLPNQYHLFKKLIIDRIKKV